MHTLKWESSVALQSAGRKAKDDWALRREFVEAIDEALTDESILVYFAPPDLLAEDPEVTKFFVHVAVRIFPQKPTWLEAPLAVLPEITPGYLGNCLVLESVRRPFVGWRERFDIIAEWESFRLLRLSR